MSKLRRLGTNYSTRSFFIEYRIVEYRIVEHRIVEYRIVKHRIVEHRIVKHRIVEVMMPAPPATMYERPSNARYFTPISHQMP